jgi:transposase
MRKHTYKSVKINAVNREKLFEMVQGIAVTVGNDVAKQTHFAALMNDERKVLMTIRWDMPHELATFVGLVSSLPASSRVVVMEPSGSYGDPLRYQLERAGIEVRRVSPKGVHDSTEVYDGVPSSHNGKSAQLIAKLHLDGRSEPWPMGSDDERDLSSLVSTMDRYAQQVQQNENRLEGILARVWPEATRILELTKVSLWKLLIATGGPEGVRKDPREARHVLRISGQHFLTDEKIGALVESARTTTGCPMTDREREELRDLAEDTYSAHKKTLKWKSKVEKRADETPSSRGMSSVVGKATAAVLVSELGDPGNFPNAKAYEKAAGLNLRERSSGTHKGEKTISKRGSSSARRWLYMGVLRLIQKDEVFRAWYVRKVARDGGRFKTLAIVALMRKLIRGLWHAGRGEVFDSTKLFDVRRLGLENP